METHNLIAMQRLDIYQVALQSPEGHFAVTDHAADLDQPSRDQPTRPTVRAK